jgi:hypothetical protein
MAKLFQNDIDGVNAQARAVLAYLSEHSGIESSWDDKLNRYNAYPVVFRWHNCREQGYVVAMRSHSRQINIAFFEHRNSDQICAIEWEQLTLSGNPPHIDNMPKSGDISHQVDHGKPSEMADWVFERLTAFWNAAASKPHPLTKGIAVK